LAALVPLSRVLRPGHELEVVRAQAQRDLAQVLDVHTWRGILP
jgi:hypothetical protein